MLYLNDGQNLFDGNYSVSGKGWQAAETALSLIASGRLPPFVIVGIDHAGQLGCPPGTSVTEPSVAGASGAC